MSPYSALFGLLSLLDPFSPLLLSSPEVCVPLNFFRLVIRCSLPLSGSSISSHDPHLPPALQSMCPGGLNATTVSSSVPFGPGGASLTTGSCEPQAPAPA